ncbi:GNAT family N-acetyltransferase [Paenibacillus sp. 1_12]|uniref:GNAT family N-acetyltransferase n=1 Tax=Paenibacillus sp. 1_12 TaxID=1566278 RepID=UPI0035293988
MYKLNRYFFQEIATTILTNTGMNIEWMKHGYFWDNTPLMNMIWIDEKYRGKVAGKQVVLFGENQMKQVGSRLVLTSIQAKEEAQHFYRRLDLIDE